MTESRPAPEFSLLTNHGKALVILGHAPRIRIADVASMLQITERSVQRIVTDLVTAGYISRSRTGRQNVYTVHRDMPLGLPIQRDIAVDSLFAILPSPVSTQPSSSAIDREPRTTSDDTRTPPARTSSRAELRLR